MLKELIMQKKSETIREYIKDIHPHDFAIEFENLSMVEQINCLKLLDIESQVDLLSYLEPETSSILLRSLELTKQKQIIDELDSDDATDIILELQEENYENLEELIAGNEAIKLLMKYEPNQAGSYMTSDLLIVTPEMDVKMATKKLIKKAPDVESINTIFVINQNEELIGIVELKKLLKAKLPRIIEEIMTETPTVLDTDDIYQVVQDIRNYGVYEMPVVTKQNKLVGMITLDDAMDIYHDEATEDFKKLAALPDVDDEANGIKTAMHRLPWLLILLALCIPISLLSSVFEEVIGAVIVLAFFQPLILDAPGDVATQTLAVTLQSLAVNKKGILKDSLTEVLSGIINGFIIGLLAFGITLLFYFIPSFGGGQGVNKYIIASVVGLTLFITISVAPLIAVVVPVALHKMKFDPAVASGPFITTLIDVTVILVYFGFATLMFLGTGVM